MSKLSLWEPGILTGIVAPPADKVLSNSSTHSVRYKGLHLILILLINGNRRWWLHTIAAG